MTASPGRFFYAYVDPCCLREKNVLRNVFIGFLPLWKFNGWIYVSPASHTGGVHLGMVIVVYRNRSGRPSE